MISLTTKLSPIALLVLGWSFAIHAGATGSSNQNQGSPSNGVVSPPVTYSTNKFNTGSTNGFFTSLGTNGRDCNTCHLPNDAWTITPATASKVAWANPSDPLFAPVDGSDCPPTQAAQPSDARKSTMLTRYGLIREQIGIPLGADFSLDSETTPTNPKGCQIPPGDPLIGGKLILYRRPLPSTNLIFLSTVRWDGRETIQEITTGPSFTNTGPLLFDLGSQANHASTGHEESVPITGTQAQTDIVTFESNLYTAPVSLQGLDLSQSNGGPKFLAKHIAPDFFIGQNDPLVGNFSSAVFTLYNGWEPQDNGHHSNTHLTGVQASIGRGEKLFNTRTFIIANVAGLNSAAGDPLYNPNDPLANTPLTGTCGTCHNTPNVGNHSTSLPINTGVTMAIPTDNSGWPIRGILNIANLPVYTLLQQSSARDKVVQVTDPGRALISGAWLDVGKTKAPILRGLAARAPYYHNGSAKDLQTVVSFYNARFNIGLKSQEINDLATFLAAL